MRALYAECWLDCRQEKDLNYIICGHLGTSTWLVKRSAYVSGVSCHISFVCHLILMFTNLTDFIQTSGHLAVPDAQKCFFVSRRGIRLPYRSPDLCSFGIRPGKSPFHAAIRTFCAPGTRLRSKPGKTRLAANLPVSGAFHHFIDFHFSSSFDNSSERSYI